MVIGFHCLYKYRLTKIMSIHRPPGMRLRVGLEGYAQFLVLPN